MILDGSCRLLKRNGKCFFTRCGDDPHIIYNKTVKNKINRANNCDSANISKTVEASIRQRAAIENLQKTDRLDSLPEELYRAALLRRNNPDSTLKELCTISDEHITVSGLNHRLNKIIEIYNELKDREKSH